MRAQPAEGDRVLVPVEIHDRVEDGRLLPLLAWRFPGPLTVASTASAGGGLGERHWIINAQVARDYGRHDLVEHGAELAARIKLAGAGVVMLTAADVRRVQAAEDGGVRVDATVGLTIPTWAAAPDEPTTGPAPGTINIVVVLPVRLQPAALLNALCTATEAKTQALLEARVPGTGTASDAVTVACPPDGPADAFAGPRSTWGARVARAVHEAVLTGAAARDAAGYPT